MDNAPHATAIAVPASADVHRSGSGRFTSDAAPSSANRNAGEPIPTRRRATRGGALMMMPRGRRLMPVERTRAFPGTTQPNRPRRRVMRMFGVMCGTNPVARSSHSASESASRQAIQIRRVCGFGTRGSIAGLFRTTCRTRSGVPSTTIASRVGSWISTICHGRPVRKSLCAPSITPSSDVTLCGSFVPAAIPGRVDVAEADPG